MCKWWIATTGLISFLFPPATSLRGWSSYLISLASVVWTSEIIVSFGDGGNDICMLSSTGYSFEPKNGCDAARKAAKAVSVWTNDEGCVVKKELLNENPALWLRTAADRDEETVLCFCLTTLLPITTLVVCVCSYLTVCSMQYLLLAIFSISFIYMKIGSTFLSCILLLNYSIIAML